MKNTTIGFFECFEENQQHIGALMITDESGIPAEFKYTEPIKPTRLQKILYGKSLERYLRHDVIRAKLFKAMSKRPEMIFVSNEDPSLVGECEGVPAMMIQRVPLNTLDAPGDREQKKDNELVIKDHETRDPVRIVSSPEHADKLEAAAELVMECAYSLDVLEPLERIREAMRAIISEAKR